MVAEPMAPDKIASIMTNHCLSKSNLTESEANEIIDRAIIESGKILYYYKCRFCLSIHLTKHPPTRLDERVSVA